MSEKETIKIYIVKALNDINKAAPRKANALKDACKMSLDFLAGEEAFSQTMILLWAVTYCLSCAPTSARFGPPTETRMTSAPSKAAAGTVSQV